MNINSFKINDEIVRTQPAKSLGVMISPLSGESIDRTGDRSYMGQRLIFKGIANGQIYCKRTDEFDLKMFGDKLLDLSVDLWSEDWSKWIDPLTLTDNVISNEDIQKQIDKAIADENYELAEKLKLSLK